MITTVAVAGNATDGTAATTIAVALGPVVVGDVITVAITGGSPNANFVQTVTDTLGTVYTPIGTALLDAVNGQSGIAYQGVVTAAGSPTITVGYLEATAWRGILAHAARGANPTTPLNAHAEQFLANPGAAADAVTSGPLTTTVANAFLLGFCWDTSNLTLPTAGTGFTNEGSAGDGANTVSGRVESKTIAVAGATAATFTLAENTLTWGIALAPAAGGGGLTLALDSVAATAELGTITFSAPTVLALDGVAATAELGTLEVVMQVVAMAETVSATATLGELTLTSGLTLALDGVAATAEVGTITFSASGTVALAFVLGVTAQAQAPSAATMSASLVLEVAMQAAAPVASVVSIGFGLGMTATAGSTVVGTVALPLTLGLLTQASVPVQSTATLSLTLGLTATAAVAVQATAGLPLALGFTATAGGAAMSSAIVVAPLGLQVTVAAQAPAQAGATVTLTLGAALAGTALARAQATMIFGLAVAAVATEQIPPALITATAWTLRTPHLEDVRLLRPTLDAVSFRTP